jgi:arylsulfatase A-like enzyme
LRSRHSIGLLCVVMLSVIATMVACESKVDDRPNIVFVLADDLGYGDLGSYGHPYALTPNLDRLAEEGTRFQHFYAASPLCIPSRAGFMTGVFPARFANYTGDFGLGDVPTVTALLHDAGYRTGHFGKWHLGADTSSGTYGIGTIERAKGRTSKALKGKRSRDSHAYDQAIRFIEKNRDGPFYVQIWGTVPHYPINPAPSFLAPFAATTVAMTDFSPFMLKKFARVHSYGGDINEGMRRYLGDVHSLDFEMGRILEKLDELGLSENTLVVFASDNGPGPSGQVGRDRGLVDRYGKDLLGSPGPFRGGKGSLYEGGARVPFIVRWPGRVPAGRVDDTSITSAVDWLPTLCGLAKISCASRHLDGEDVSSAWMGGAHSRTRPLFWKDSWTNAPIAIRWKHWKLREGRPPNRDAELYDVISDPGETENLAAAHPAVAADLQNRIREWDETLPSRYARKQGR